ncbi:hypothetical protein T01_6482 [Trichinella spiralis]|uniref:Uncharacterized protein n=1 Tax=Trichinella spiralis TaxID=6334 RepID=A0A0V1BCC6_TRISP|nr:hypothetical protein T01_6482 [Trichinella spiralis]
MQSSKGNCQAKWALNLAYCLIQYTGQLPSFFAISQEIGDRAPPAHVCCTPLIISDRPIPIKSIFGVRLNQPRAKLYCSEISKKLFPDYHDRRTTIRTCSNMCIHSECSYT